jgi:hypothetical protein
LTVANENELADFLLKIKDKEETKTIKSFKDFYK